MMKRWRSDETDEIRQMRSTRRYRTQRRGFLAANPLCQICGKDGIITIANELDHIKPCHGDVSLFWDQTNWQGLCTRCHTKKTAKENQKNVTEEELEWEAHMERWDRGEFTRE